MCNSFHHRLEQAVATVAPYTFVLAQGSAVFGTVNHRCGNEYNPLPVYTVPTYKENPFVDRMIVQSS